MRASSRIDGPVVYRWADGSDVRLVARPRLNEVRLSVQSVGHPFGDKNVWLQPSLLSDGQVRMRALDLEMDSFRDEEVSAQVRGLVLDLGAVPVVLPFPQPAGRLTSGLVQIVGAQEAQILLPHWMSEEAWDRRYETAETSPEALVEGLDLEVWPKAPHERGGVWLGKWTKGSGKVGGTQMGSSLEHLVDMALQDWPAMPESKRAAWEEKNVVRGEFVEPSIDEVEVYRLLGTPLPYFWPATQVSDWICERELGAVGPP